MTSSVEAEHRTVLTKDGRKPRVVIIGAGFAGLWAAKGIDPAKFEVILIDRNNYHTFHPLLYQVASAELEPEEIAYPVRGAVSRLKNVACMMAEVEHVDFDGRIVTTNSHSVPYDYLILALGSETNFFGVPGAEEHAYQLKSLEQGILLRNHILSLFEKSAWEESTTAQRSALTFAVVGGGPTGVEYAGALAELVRGPLKRDFPRLNISQSRIILVEAADGLLSGFPEELREYALKELSDKGVEVNLKAQVAEVTPESVVLQDGTVIPTETVVWSAGVRGTAFAEGLGLPLGPGRRITVRDTLQTEKYPEVFVVGDAAVIDNGSPLPMIAPVAVQQAKHAAKNIKRLSRGAPLKAFRYRDKGAMATIGRNAAVVRFAGKAFTGFPAWTVWLFVHLFYLIGFRNRLLVLVNWGTNYVFYERAVRLILPKGADWVGKNRPDAAPEKGKI